jgi:thiol-disulfide isomerase/thioredoxin
MQKNNFQRGSGMILVVLAIILLVGGYLYVAKTPADEGSRVINDVEKAGDLESKVVTEEIVPMDAAMIEGVTEPLVYRGDVLAGKTDLLLDFKKADYEMALKSDKLIVLYFFAKWCPTCIAEFPVMMEVFDELTEGKVIGFRVNYNDDDTDADEKGLAREFGVPYQHTKVFVKNGKRILKSPETWDDKRYHIEISKASAQ